MTASELCEHCEEDKATVSRALCYLEDNGFIYRNTNCFKRYKSPLYLTDKGQAAGKRIAEKISDVLDIIGCTLTKDERAAFYRSLSAISRILEKEKKRIIIVALVDTLEYLKRGGRISKAAAFAGGVLNIKPVLSVTDGEIRLLGKARGSKMGNNLLIQEINRVGGIDFSKPVLLGYSGISDALLLKYIEDSRHIWEGNLKEIRYTTVGSVIGTHVGARGCCCSVF